MRAEPLARPLEASAATETLNNAGERQTKVEVAEDEEGARCGGVGAAGARSALRKVMLSLSEDVSEAQTAARRVRRGCAIERALECDEVALVMYVVDVQQIDGDAVQSPGSQQHPLPRELAVLKERRWELRM